MLPNIEAWAVEAAELATHERIYKKRQTERIPANLVLLLKCYAK